MIDIFDNGVPKYSTATSVYDALCELMHTEEMNILSEIGVEDVSYDGQTYYYTDNGYKLKEKFEKLSDYGDKFWLFDLAIFQLNNDNCEIHDIVYEALNNADLAKRIGFKKTFVDELLMGSASQYNEIAEAYAAELSELNRFDGHTMSKIFVKVKEAHGSIMYVSPYPNFSHALYKKVMGLKLPEHTQLIVECRALLTSYDDFILGLRVNQALHEQLERQYNDKVIKLQAEYDEKVRQLSLSVETQSLDWASSKNLLPMKVETRLQDKVS